jgi:endonuclease I
VRSSPIAVAAAARFTVRVLVALCVLSVPRSPWADPPPGYYDSVNASTPELLRSTLHAVIDDHTRFPYSSGGTDTWDILELADQNPNNTGHILDLYRNRSLAKFGGGNGPYNREHTWPNSYGFPDDGGGNYPYTDCHHLFLCDVGYNGDRANLPFGNVTAAATERVTDANNGQGGGAGVFPGNSNWFTALLWQTWNGRRGDVARALFYMDIRYEGGNHGGTGAAEPNLILTDDVGLIVGTGNNAPVAYMGLLGVLLQWHAEDPVDDRERWRNDTVYTYQQNRNPFIDHPEWVAAIFAPATDAVVAVAQRAAITRLYPNPMNPMARVAFVVAQPGPVRIDVYAANGRFVRTLLDSERPAGSFEVRWDGDDRHGVRASSGAYLVRLQSQDTIDTRKVTLVR